MIRTLFLIVLVGLWAVKGKAQEKKHSFYINFLAERQDGGDFVGSGIYSSARIGAGFDFMFSKHLNSHLSLTTGLSTGATFHNYKLELDGEPFLDGGLEFDALRISVPVWVEYHLPIGKAWQGTFLTGPSLNVHHIDYSLGSIYYISETETFDIEYGAFDLQEGDFPSWVEVSDPRPGFDIGTRFSKTKASGNVLNLGLIYHFGSYKVHDHTYSYNNRDTNEVLASGTFELNTNYAGASIGIGLNNK